MNCKVDFSGAEIKDNIEYCNNIVMSLLLCELVMRTITILQVTVKKIVKLSVSNAR